MGRPPKVENLLGIIKTAVSSGMVRFTEHALERIDQRLIRAGILPSAVTHVLRHGYHDPRRDQWDERHKSWNYAIQGKTLSGERLRIPIAIEVMSNGHIIVVVTVINLEIEE